MKSMHDFKSILSKLKVGKKDIKHLLPLIIGCFLAILTFLNINSPKFSYVGDEYAFYEYAEGLLSKIRCLDFSGLFSLTGVYGTYPALGSYWQALFLLFFGKNHSSWLLSNIILLIPVVLLIFAIAKNVFNERVAYFTLVFFSTSSFIYGFYKIGYLNNISMLWFLLTTYAFFKLIDEPFLFRKQFLMGLSLGASFYFLFGPLVQMIFLILLVTMYAIRFAYSHYKIITFSQRFRKFFLQPLINIYFFNLFFLLPGLFSFNEFLKNSKSHSILDPEFSISLSALIKNIYHFFLVPFKNYDYFNNHYVYGAYFDRFSQLFILIGLLFLTVVILRFVYLSINHRKTKKFKGVDNGFNKIVYFMGLYVLTTLVFAVTSPYPYTPVTRGLFVIFFGAVFAGYGLFKICFYIRNRKYFKKQKRGCSFLIVSLFILLSLVNFYKSNIFYFKIMGSHHYANLFQSIINNDLQKPFVIISRRDEVINVLDNLFDVYYNVGTEEIGISFIIADNNCCANLVNNKVVNIYILNYEKSDIFNQCPCLEDNRYNLSMISGYKDSYSNLNSRNLLEKILF